MESPIVPPIVTVTSQASTISSVGNITTEVSPGVSSSPWYLTVQEKMSEMFRSLGILVGHHPLWFIILPILICGALGCGIIILETETDLETLYLPNPSTAITHRQRVRDLFPNVNHVAFDPFAQSDLFIIATLMFKADDNKDVFQEESVNEIRSIIQKIKNITVEEDSKSLSFENLCARRNSTCVIRGESFLSPPIQRMLKAGLITYPFATIPGSTEQIDLSSFIAQPTIKTPNILTAAKVFKLTFFLKEESLEWEKSFLSTAEASKPQKTNLTYGAYNSLSDELYKGTVGDIKLFISAFVISIIFATLVSSGGDMVSTRGLLANCGVVIAGLSILGSLGFASLCGIKFVNLAGVMPFLLIGIGVDDMFLLMSSWSETLENTDFSVPERLGATLAHAGISITITSVTDFASFIIGAASKFGCIVNFAIFTAVAVLICYILQITVFGGCLVLHGKRVYSQRHILTYRKTKSRRKLEEEGMSRCGALLCGGESPSTHRGDESMCEKLPRMLLHKLFHHFFVSIAIVIGFMAYLAASIYGAIHLPQGLILSDLVPRSSYYHAFLVDDNKYFPISLPISFVIAGNYKNGYENKLETLLKKALEDKEIRSDYTRCWLTDYVRQPYFSKHSFMSNLANRFLPANSRYYTDVVLDFTNSSITASRCYVVSKPMNNQYEMADLMVRMRKLAIDSPLRIFPFNPFFLVYEQFLEILPATLQLMGIALAVITVACGVFLPHPFMVLLVTITVAMILVGIFGFMYYWNTPLSSITMIHLVMSVGFSVDFSAHVCTAYLLSSSGTRGDRVRYAISHAASPIFNGGSSSLLGVIMLVFSDSYIFISFFRIMVLVISFGMLHAVLFLPAVLSLIGPQENSVLTKRKSTTSAGSRMTIGTI